MLFQRHCRLTSSNINSIGSTNSSRRKQKSLKYLQIVKNHSWFIKRGVKHVYPVAVEIHNFVHWWSPTDESMRMQGVLHPRLGLRRSLFIAIHRKMWDCRMKTCISSVFSMSFNILKTNNCLMKICILYMFSMSFNLW